MTERSEESVPATQVQAPPRTVNRVRLIAVAVLVLVGVGLATWAVRSVFRTAATEVSMQTSAPPERVSPEAGALAPEFEVPGYDGRPLRLAAFQGHPIVLNFWASWCPPCKAEAGLLESAYLTYRHRGVVFIGIDLENDSWEASRAFLAQYGITYPAGRDESGKVGHMYRVVAIPTTYFIGVDGTIRAGPFTGGFIGPQAARDLALQIEKLLVAP